MPAQCYHDLSRWDRERDPDKVELEVPHSATLDSARADFVFRSNAVWQDGKAFHSLRMLNPEKAFDLTVDCLLRAGVKLSANDGPLFDE